MRQYKVFVGGQQFIVSDKTKSFNFTDMTGGVDTKQLAGFAAIDANDTAKTVTVSFSELSEVAEITKSHSRLAAVVSVKRSSNRTVKGSKHSTHKKWGGRAYKYISTSKKLTFTYAELFTALDGHQVRRMKRKGLSTFSDPYVDIRFMLAAIHSGGTTKCGNVRGLKTNWNRCRCYLNSSMSAIDRIVVTYSPD